MELEDVYKYLCENDERNPIKYICYPFYETDQPIKLKDEDLKQLKKLKGGESDCMCENCINGQDELAREILRLRKELGWKY